MKEIIEHYGVGLAEMIAIFFCWIIILAVCRENGVLWEIVWDYFNTICGMEY